MTKRRRDKYDARVPSPAETSMSVAIMLRMMFLGSTFRTHVYMFTSVSGIDELMEAKGLQIPIRSFRTVSIFVKKVMNCEKQTCEWSR